jgi:Kef-type K+ transport system membrane component KefB
MFDNIFYQIGAILGLAAAGGALALLLHQPLIVAFIAVGILLGPSGVGVVVQSGEIELFARLGIALLLFVVGLKLDAHTIRPGRFHLCDRLSVLSKYLVTAMSALDATNSPATFI